MKTSIDADNWSLKKVQVTLSVLTEIQRALELPTDSAGSALDNLLKERVLDDEGFDFVGITHMSFTKDTCAHIDGATKTARGIWARLVYHECNARDEGVNWIREKVFKWLEEEVGGVLRFVKGYPSEADFKNFLRSRPTSIEYIVDWCFPEGADHPLDRVTAIVDEILLGVPPGPFTGIGSSAVHSVHTDGSASVNHGALRKLEIWNLVFREPESQLPLLVCFSDLGFDRFINPLPSRHVSHVTDYRFTRGPERTFFKIVFQNILRRGLVKERPPRHHDIKEAEREVNGLFLHLLDESPNNFDGREAQEVGYALSGINKALSEWTEKTKQQLGFSITRITNGGANPIFRITLTRPLFIVGVIGAVPDLQPNRIR